MAFKYDVAFSLLNRDEPLAREIADLLSDRYSVFLYSARDTEVLGADGELRFKTVFAKEARFVVVLYRPGWGTTPWTRMEEEAIRGRAYDAGYDFVKFIPLEPPAVPIYLPKTQLWINGLHYGAKGAASIIEARLEELGAVTRPESAIDRAARLDRAMKFAEQKEKFSTSYDGVSAADGSFQAIGDAVQEQVRGIEAQGLGVKFSVKRDHKSVVVLGLRKGMRIAWRRAFANTLEGAKLALEIWEGHPPMDGITFFENPTKLKTKNYVFELQPDGLGRWVRDKGEGGGVDASAFADNALKFYMDQQ